MSKIVLDCEEKKNKESQYNKDSRKLGGRNSKTTKLEKKAIHTSQFIGLILMYLLMIFTIIGIALLSMYFK